MRRLPALALAALVAVAPVRAAPPGDPVRAAWPPAFDARLRQAFATPPGKPDAPYAAALAYLLTSFQDRALAGGSAVDQPGEPSRHGPRADAMEGFTRLAPVVAAWLAGGRPAAIDDLRGRRVDLLAWLRAGIVSGVTPAAPGYWGEVADLGQGIVEAADVARSAWIARDLLMPTLSADERAALGAWLGGVARLRVSDNNWHLYPVLITEILGALGLPSDPGLARRHFARFMEFRLGDGWYSDGPDRADVDWYNAWGIQFELWWIRRVSPGYGGDVVGADVRAFADLTPSMIGPEGIPIMGRSVCYRMAAPSAAVAGALPGPDRAAIDPGLARRALDSVFGYFVENGAFRDGVVTQGYCGADPRVLDNYSGPSSCLWSLRPLILAFLAPRDAPFWTAPERPLPVETGDYAISLPTAGWTLRGIRATGDVRLVRPGTPPDAAPVVDALDAYGMVRRAMSAVLWRPFRPDNHRAKYDLPIYSSRVPFCGCAGSPASSLALSSAPAPQAAR